MQFLVIIPSTHEASGSEGQRCILQLISNIHVNDSVAQEATGWWGVFPLSREHLSSVCTSHASSNYTIDTVASLICVMAFCFSAAEQMSLCLCFFRCHRFARRKSSFAERHEELKHFHTSAILAGLGRKKKNAHPTSARGCFG